MLKKILIILILLIFNIAVVSACDNQTSDIIAAEEDIPGNFTELQNIVNDAQEGSTINLDKNYSYAEGDSQDGVIISKSLTINGNGAVLDGKNSSRIVSVVGAYGDETARRVVLKDISFINGNADYGSAIYVNDSDYSKSMLYLNKCEFINNTAEYWGGAIYFTENSETSVLDVDNSVFIHNSAANQGGAISAPIVKIKRSSFIRNSVEINAGAIYALSIKVNKCMFDSNSALSGGVMEIVDSLEVAESNFTNNYAGCDGGVFSPCDLKYFKIQKSNFINNTAEGEGGVAFFGISPVTTKITISDSLFKSNKARSGGVLACRGEYGTVKLTNNKFIKNTNQEVIIKFLSSKSDKVFKVIVISTINKKQVKNKKISLIFFKSYDDPEDSVTLRATTDSRGIASFKSISKYLDKYGNYDFSVKGCGVAYFDYSDIFVDKCPTIVKAPKITVKYKKSNFFKITVKNKANGKPVKKVKIKVKVYTDKKYKSYTLKTNVKGVAKFNTKKLKKGSHKVVISSGSSNYKISAKSSIKVK